MKFCISIMLFAMSFSLAAHAELQCNVNSRPLDMTEAQEIQERISFLKTEFGFRADGESPRFKASPWRAQDLRLIEEVLSSLPSDLAKLGQNPWLNGKAVPIHKVYGLKSNYGDIALMGELFDSRNPDLRDLITHEIAHQIGSRLAGVPIEQTPEWRSLSGWAEDDSIHSPKANFVTPYASKDAMEDFAETIMVYRNNPNLLKSRTPKKYEFARKFIFEGLEYLTPASCQKSPYSSILRNLLPAEEISFAAQSCSPRLLNSDLSIDTNPHLGFKNSFAECLMAAIGRRLNVLASDFKIANGFSDADFAFFWRLHSTHIVPKEELRSLISNLGAKVRSDFKSAGDYAHYHAIQALSRPSQLSKICQENFRYKHLETHRGWFCGTCTLQPARTISESAAEKWLPGNPNAGAQLFSHVRDAIIKTCNQNMKHEKSQRDHGGSL